MGGNGKFDLEYEAIVDGIVEGKVIPFLGAGVNLCDRPGDAVWEPDKSAFLPNGAELAAHLAKRFSYPLPDRDLARVSQFVVELRGPAPLYARLRQLLSVPPQINDAHRFLARLPAKLRAKKAPSPNLLVVTTNYDDCVEAAFAQAGEPLEVVSYVADTSEERRNERGKFVHHLASGKRRLIERPNEYREVSVVKTCVLLKIHGALDRAVADNDSFVITEDHYIDFLTRTDLSNLVPVMLAAQLRASHFLFLGYSLRDWNLRVILQRIWEEQRLGYNSWAVQKDSDALDRRFWGRRNVEILETDLDEFFASVDEGLDAVAEGAA
ncbi:MAG TPA: SIR2 family protein [Thermoanaerobaculia bacterium]|nr:SIR2 family protein [Thermoanaerobaculia bacterium]